MEETDKELFDSRLVFTRALDAIIPEGKGVFVIIDDVDLVWGIKKMIVHKKDDVIGILNAEERDDLKNGDWVTLVDENIIRN